MTKPEPALKTASAGVIGEAKATGLACGGAEMRCSCGTAAVESSRATATSLAKASSGTPKATIWLLFIVASIGVGLAVHYREAPACNVMAITDGGKLSVIGL